MSSNINTPTSSQMPQNNAIRPQNQAVPVSTSDQSSHQPQAQQPSIKQSQSNNSSPQVKQQQVPHPPQTQQAQQQSQNAQGGQQQQAPTPTPTQTQQQQQQRRPTQQFSAQDLNNIVLEYLNKKGYLKAEAMLRVESSRIPTEPSQQVHTSISKTPITDAGPTTGGANNASNANNVTSIESVDPESYERGYSMLRTWVENSLDIYRPELYRVLYPIFVHCFLDLVGKNCMVPARLFFNKFCSDHEILHGSEISKLSGIGNKDHLKENELAQMYKKNDYILYVTKTSLNLLLYFLHENEAIGGSTIISLINRYIKPIIITTSESQNLENIRGSLNDGIIANKDKSNGIDKFNQQPIKLGKFPIDSEFSKEVELELRKRDEKSNRNANGLLIDEFKLKTETLEDEDSPLKDVLPLPNKTAYDVKREILKIKESRDKIKLDSTQVCAPSVCMYTFHNTNDDLTTLEFNDDSTLIAGGFQDSYIKIWSLDGQPLKSVFQNDKYNEENSRKLIGHSGSVYGLNFSPDNRYLLSSSEDKTVKLWSLDTYTPLVNYKGHNHPVWDVKFSPFGHYFATGSHDQTARLWSCDHIYPLRIFAGHINDVDVVEFHPNSTYVFTGSSDKSCRMWDISKGNSVRIFNGHTGPINTICVSPDGRWLASAGEDGIINIWDIGLGRKLKSMRGHGRTSIYSLAFSQEGSLLISGGADNSVRVWDIKRCTSEAGPMPEEKFPNLNDDTTRLTLTNNNNTSSATGKEKIDEARRKKEIIPTPDHLASFFTKRTPVYKVHFTRGNLCLAAGAFRG